jgi:hypothetical protein
MRPHAATILFVCHALIVVDATIARFTEWKPCNQGILLNIEHRLEKGVCGGNLLIEHQIHQAFGCERRRLV